MGQRDPALSVVVPMYNEESVLPLARAPGCARVLDGLGEPYEVVAVDDGSTDGTAGRPARGLRAVWPAAAGRSGCAATAATRPR